MIKNKKFIINLIIIMLFSMSVFGCGNEISKDSENDTKEEDITLVDPVGVTEDYDVVALKNLYQADVYSGSVNPSVTEYGFSKDQTFKSFGVLPGLEVSNNDVLVYSENNSIDKQIEAMAEEISDLEADYQMEVDALNKDIYDAKKLEYELSQDVHAMYSWEPDEENNKVAHDQWASLYMKPDGVYKRAKQNKERLIDSLNQKIELFNLEHEYKVASLERLKEKIYDTSVLSDMDGEVVSCGFYYDGDFIKSDEPIVAVGNTNDHIIKTEYISKGNINKALDYYAVIDGKRYELIYEPMETSEYNQIINNGGTAYTTFHIEDPNNEISIGQYAVVVVIKDERIQVPCIPIDSLKKESDSYYVYLFDGTSSIYTAVEIGMKDGLFAEVLSGLNVGDKVLSAQSPKNTKNTAQITKGDYVLTADVGGYLYYPFSEWLTNPVNTGTTYVKEICVVNNENVSKGQIVAKLEVIPDKVEIERLSRQINRLQVRLVKLLKEKADNDAKNKVDRALEKSISSNQKNTNMYLRKLNKLNKYSGIINITAPFDGIILDAETVKEGDLLYEDSKVVQLSSTEQSYIILKDDKNQFNYGSHAEISINDSELGRISVDGVVATINNIYLSKELSNEWALVAVDKENANSFSGSSLNSSGRWDRNNYKVKITTRDMKNVLLVPKAAVTMKDRCTYVNVVDNDGNVSIKSFIAGGSDNNFYWVVDGLEEGMTVCWE